MNVETWAKALTAMETGLLVPEVLPDGMARVVYDQQAHDAYCCGIGSTSSGLIDKPTPLIALAAACDALSLPWQQHPVWRMKQALEVWLPVMWSAKYDEVKHEYTIRVAADTWQKLHSEYVAALAAAKGGG